MRALVAAVAALIVSNLIAPAFAADPAELPASMTPAEREYLRNNFQEYLRAKRARSRTSAKPDGLMIAPAEHQKLDGVSFAWTRFPALQTQLVKHTAQVARAYVAVRSESEQSQIAAHLQSEGVNMGNVTFDRVPFNSIWMRDYGPNIAYTKDGDRVVVDLAYNRPRPLDDAYPTAFANARKLPVHAPPLILPGGNLIVDGHGVAIMTDMVFDAQHGSDPNLTQGQLEAYFKDYFGVSKVIVLKQMKQDGTGHCDMFTKLINDDTFIVGEYANAEDGAEDNKAILDENARILASHTNGQGKPYRVVRMPMPKWDGETTKTYTNSLIVNDKVLVPVYGDALDEQALNIYRTLMPGADVVGLDCSDIIHLNGAIHCITHEINADPLDVAHAPPQTQGDQVFYLNARVDSIEPLTEVTLYWRAGCASFIPVPMVQSADQRNVWTIDMPALAEGTMIEYYIEAKDARGMTETFPEDAGNNNSQMLVIGEQNGARRASLPGFAQLLGL
jgi:agmatine deiminase